MACADHGLDSACGGLAAWPRARLRERGALGTPDPGMTKTGRDPPGTQKRLGADEPTEAGTRPKAVGAVREPPVLNRDGHSHVRMPVELGRQRRQAVASLGQNLDRLPARLANHVEDLSYELGGNLVVERSLMELTKTSRGRRQLTGAEGARARSSGRTPVPMGSLRRCGSASRTSRLGVGATPEIHRCTLWKGPSWLPPDGAAL